MKTFFFLASFVALGITQAQIYQNNTPINVPDATNVTGDCGSASAAGNASRLIDVPLIDTITDPSKVVININIAHTWSGDVVAELRTPAGNSCALIKRIGANGPAACGVSCNFSAGNTLSFSANNSVTIPYQALNSSENIPAGNYTPTEGFDSTHYPMLIPLCNLNSFLNGASTAGNWALVMYDFGVGDAGSINSWQIIFAPGFGDPASNLNVNQEIILTQNVSVLGNPFTDQLSLTLNEISTRNIVSVYSIDGKQVFQKSISHAEASNVIHIETISWPKGIYILQITTGEKLNQPIKIIKK